MNLLRRAIPSPGNLLIFEAAARLGSFTRAAEDLGMTQAAVSYGIRSLERSLGAALFLRSHRMVRLTETGQRFFHDVSIGLTHIQQSVAAIQRVQADRHVTLSISTSFASFWMLPRLAMFRVAHPDIDLRFLATDRDVDIASERIALGVRRGDGRWPGYDAAMLAPEYLYPVCSAAYLRDAFDGRGGGHEDGLLAIADLPRLKLIHLEEPYRYRPTWTDWFAGQGHPFVDNGGGLRLNDYSLVVQAALEGQGVALGWGHLLDHLVARGALLRVVDGAWRTGANFWVVSARQLSAEARRVRDWLIADETRRSVPGSLID